MSDSTALSTLRRLLLSVINAGVILLLLLLLALAGSRLFHWEDSALVITAESVSFYLFALGYPAMIFAVLAKRRPAILLSAIVILCHVFWVLPEFTASRSLPDEVAAAPKFTLLSHNVKFDNTDLPALEDSLRTATADVIFIQELSWEALQPIRDTNALAQYPYEVVEPAGAQGLGIFSKLPLHDAQLIQSAGFPTLRATIDVGGQRVTLYNVHAQSPVYGATHFWQDDLAQLRTELHAETGPSIAAGDFNAGYGHRPFRELLEHGWHDAHMDLGRGTARTWPMDRLGGANFNGYIRLDHVLTSPDVRATHIEETPGDGSDHRGLIADIAVLPPS